MGEEKQVKEVWKRVYVVRHGETDFNKEERTQPHDAPLSTKGILQAAALAAKFRNIEIDRIFSSDMTRAADTARMIADVTGKELVFMELLREVKRPSEITGLYFTDPASRAIRQAMREHEHDPVWHYSDEENVCDTYVRAEKIKVFLTELLEASIAVVSHGIFMCMLLCVMVTKNQHEATEMYCAIRRNLHHDNAGLTIFEYGIFSGVAQWRLCTWNDTAHLA